MTDMFTQAANFNSMLDSTEPLHVSEVVHKAFIEITEDGAEAAAATGKYLMQYIPFNHCALYLFNILFILFPLNSSTILSFSSGSHILLLVFIRFIYSLLNQLHYKSYCSGLIKQMLIAGLARKKRSIMGQYLQADHPFHYFIYSQSMATPIFCGSAKIFQDSQSFDREHDEL